ncbi:hypothetical protein T439DRAFT_217195 [Meredithblackwellia eburnea MCA 4105]
MAVFTTEAPISFLATLLLLLVVGKRLAGLLARFRRNVLLLQDYPGLRLVVNPQSAVALVLPRFRALNAGRHFLLRNPAVYEKKDESNVISLVSLFPPARAFFVADPITVAAILVDRNRFSSFGLKKRNGITVQDCLPGSYTKEGRSLKKALRLFEADSPEQSWERACLISEHTLSRWETTIKGGADQFTVPSLLEEAREFNAVLRCGNSEGPTDTEPSFRSSLLESSRGRFIEEVCSTWIFNRPLPSLRSLRKCSQSLKSCIQTRLEVYRSQKPSSARLKRSRDKKDSSHSFQLYASSESEDAEDGDAEDGEDGGDVSISNGDDTITAEEDVVEIIQRTLVAAHDTSSNYLTSALVMLALNPAEQRKLHQEVEGLVPHQNQPSFQVFAELTRLQAFLKETWRLLPASYLLHQYSLDDSVVPKSQGDDSDSPRSIFIPSGTDVFIDIHTMHRNKKYWGEDASEFRPERFIASPDGSSLWPREAYFPLSVAQSHLNLQLDSLAVTAFLVVLLRKFSVHLVEDLDGSGARRAPKGETFVEKFNRVTKPSAFASFTTLTLKSSSLVFVKREGSRYAEKVR